MIHARIDRTHPVVISPYVVPFLLSGRVRALVLPRDCAPPVRPGDGLWVQEGITIASKQPRKDDLRVKYPGAARDTSVPWNPRLAKPGPGYRSPKDMPRPTSRMTLLVERAEHMRLEQVDEDTAIAAGVMPEAHGYGALGYPFLEPFQSHASALGFAVAPGQLNPEVVVIHFRAVARNIERMLQHGG